MSRFISSAEGIPGVGVGDDFPDLPELEAGVPSGTGLSDDAAERIFALAVFAASAVGPGLATGTLASVLVFAFVMAIFTFGDLLLALFDAGPPQEARNTADSGTSKKILPFIMSFQYSCAGWWRHPKGTGTFRPTGTRQVFDSDGPVEKVRQRDYTPSRRSDGSRI